MQDCNDPRPHRNGQTAGAPPRIIDGVRYGECGHPLETAGGRLTWCGSLYVVPDNAMYTAGRPCCGDPSNHREPAPVLGLD